MELRRLSVVAVVVSLLCAAAAAPSGNFSKLVFPGRDGKLRYNPDAYNNIIPDFSNCGYRGGGVALPDVPVKATVLAEPESSKDDGRRIQEAIDRVSKLEADGNGFRGAILIKRGTYHIGGQLKISASGVVLRGEGDGESNGTLLIATGNKPRTLIVVEGRGGAIQGKGRVKITDDYVPVGARSFNVENASGLKVGDKVIVNRVGNKEWIHFIAMDRITPRPDDPKSTKQWEPFDLPFDRVVTGISGNKISVDAPIVCAIEQKWGGGTLAKYEDAERIENVGVENLRSDSEYNAKITKEREGKPYPADEEHAHYFVGFDNLKNAWARNLTTTHYYNGPVTIDRNAKWVTVQDCTSLEPVSEITGGRRYPFNIAGQLNLVQRCKSDKGRHAFVFSSHVCGPNVFLDCASTNDYATSEPHHRWSVGGLYDNVHAHMAFQDRQYMGSGHGWAGANYVIWNGEGTLVCQQPPTAQNWAIGFVGQKESGAFPRPDGYWESFGKHVTPRSLYLKQLEDRLGADAVKAISSNN